MSTQLTCLRRAGFFTKLLLTVFLLSGVPMRAKADGSLSAAAARPNLVPGAINLSAYSVVPGGQVEIAFTMSNTGTGPCPPSFTGIYLGQQPSSLPPNALLTYTTVDIPANSSVRQTNFVTIPLNTPAGTYYLWVVADDIQNSPINQTTRADDVARSSALAVVTVVRQPNLVPQNVTLSASAALPGDSITVSWTLTNTANVTCPATLTGFRLGASSNTPPATSGLLSGRFETPEIPAVSGIRFTNILTIPTNALLGTYYVWVIADDVPNSRLNQSSRADDAARSPALSVVLVITHPNLVPQDISISRSQVRPRDSLEVAWTVRNAGNKNAPASTTGLHLGISASSAPTNDVLNLKISTPAIATNAFVRQTNLINIPANATLGTNYLWVVVDDVTNSAMDQSSRTDDAARSGPIAIVSVLRQPNLVATNVVLDVPVARPGDRVSASWMLTNAGNANCPPSQTALRLGSSRTVRPTNSVLNLSIATPEIRTNSVLRQTNVFTIPTNAPLGTNYVWVIADADPNSTVDQSSKSDDAIASGPLAIATVLPRPNLVPLNVTLNRSSAQPGDQITVAWTMTNSGSATCPPSVTGLYLGSSGTTRPQNPESVLVPTPSIGANTFVRQTNTFTVPPNTSAGTYYVWVIADDVTNSTLDQTSRADDAAPSTALAVLTVTLIAPAASAVVEAPPGFEWNVSGAPNVRIYLSTKANPVPGTDKLAFIDVPAGTNKFRPTATNWAATVTTLAYAQNYLWTVGSADAAKPQVYTDWQPFKVLALPIGVTAKRNIAGSFQFVIAAPNQPQVLIEGSENLSNWTQVATIPNTSGTVTYVEPISAVKAKRYFRVKP